MPCPLCLHSGDTLYHVDRRREYHQCAQCHFVFVPPQWHLSAEEEKAEYDKHENTVDDPGYRRFLSRLSGPLLAHMSPASQCLEFGCGPGPALAAVLREHGHQVVCFDPNYFPDTRWQERQFDVITATEVIEHLADPHTELTRLWARLKPRGMLGLMSKLVLNAEAFTRWHYKNDPTHIGFFSRQSLAWLCGHLHADIEYLADDAYILHKKRLNVGS